MPRTYTKMEMLSDEVFKRKEAGETNRQIAESYGLTKKQIKQYSRFAFLCNPRYAVLAYPN